MKITTERLRADLLLFLVAIIWGSAFAVQRVAGQWLDYFSFNGLRFLLGGAALAPAALWGLNLPAKPGARGWLDWKCKAMWIGLAGFILFSAAALQQAGLEYTTAGNAGFFTSLYVVFVPFLLWIFWKQRISQLTWVAAFVAVFGAGLLSTGGVSLSLAPGDGLEILGAGLWALHMIVVGKAVRAMNVVRFSVGQYLVAGILNLVAGLVSGKNLTQGLQMAWWTILYVGILSTALGYTLQAVGQQHAPPSDAAILLSLEAVFAALSGWIFLEEKWSPVQFAGCLLIFTAVLLSQMRQDKQIEMAQN